MALKKLVIVRTAKGGEVVMQDFLDRFKDLLDRDSGISQPIAVKPIAWGLESQASHVGVLLSVGKLKQVAELKEWEAANSTSTVLELQAFTAVAVDAALLGVGLHIHPLAD